MLFLINLAFQVAVYLIIGAVILSMIAQVTRARWLDSPVVRGIVGLGLALCEPFRRLMERFGIPTRPIDFSPMVAILALQVLQRLVIGLLL